MTKLLVVSNEPYRAGFGSTNRQRVARAAVKLGFEVDYLETIGWSPRSSDAVIIDGVRVLHARNLVPWSAKPPNVLGRAVNHLLTARQLRPYKYDYVINYDPFALGILMFVSAEHHVYDCVDAYEYQPQYRGAISSWLLSTAERHEARRADVRIATSATLRDKKSEIWKLPVVLQEGCHENFTRIASPVPPGPTVALLVSALDAYKLNPVPILSWLDCDTSRTLVVAGARRHGGSTDIDRLLKHPQVRVVGVVGAHEFDELARECHFGWISLADNEYSKFSFPLKIWDYMSRNLPVVAVGAPGLGRVPNLIDCSAWGEAGPVGEYWARVSAEMRATRNLGPELWAAAREHVAAERLKRILAVSDSNPLSPTRGT